LTRIRTRFAAIALAVLAPATIAACGGSSSPSFNPQTVLHQTFNNPKSISSGNLAATMNAQGGQGSFALTVNGPFQGTKGNTSQLPQFDFTAKVTGSGGAAQSINFEGGLTVTQSAAYVSYLGTAYQVPSQLFSQFKTAYLQAAQATKASGGSSNNSSSLLKRLGIDPSTWLTNVKADGTTDIGGVTTDHISGDADIGAIASDLGKIEQSVPGAQAQGLNSSGINQLKSEIKSAHIDVYSGADDHLLRKLALSLDISPPTGSGGTVNLAVTLTNVNQAQTIKAPPNPQPVPKPILRRIEGLSALGALGSGGSTSGLPSTGPSGAGSTNEQKYLRCIQKATGNSINACAKYL
jgi:hypothetical protein